MTEDPKLRRLRDKYLTGKGGEVHDPGFRRVADLQFRGGETRVLPFANPATFLAAPYRPDAYGLADFGGIEVALVGVPMDLGVTNRAGARLGPRAVRAVERIGPYEHALRMVPGADCRVADIGDVPFNSRFSLESCHQDIEAFYTRLAAAGVVPLSVGGDHSISYSILRALGRDRPVGMVHFDAHCDTGDDYLGSKFHHGAPFRRAAEEGLLDPKRTIQIGIRGGINDRDLWRFSHDSGMRVVYMEELYDKGPRAIAEEARRIVGDGPTYVSFDVDGLDPVYAPGTGTPECGGMSVLEAQIMVRRLQGLNLVAGDVVEVAPPFDPSGNTALVGATMMFEILCVVADAIAKRKG